MFKRRRRSVVGNERVCLSLEKNLYLLCFLWEFAISLFETVSPGSLSLQSNEHNCGMRDNVDS